MEFPPNSPFPTTTTLAVVHTRRDNPGVAEFAREGKYDDGHE